ncbi:MAG: plasmid mobilization relaxosome protein MobC [Clostridia bacterium]
MKKRERNIQKKFRVNEKENKQIQENMKYCGITNMGLYLRKMALNGYLLQLDLKSIDLMLKTLRATNNSLNQLVKKLHQTGNIYIDDIDEIKKSYEEIRDNSANILKKLLST